MTKLLILSFVGSCFAHEPITTKLTWTQEISRIVNNRCIACHAAGSSVSFASYDEARPWAKAIAEEVLERRMPPWGAVKGFGEFRDDPSLTQPEIDMIVNWVEGGAPKGDDIFLLAPSRAEPVRTNVPARGPVVRNELPLKTPLTVTGVRPVRIDEGGWMQVTATLPDGAVRNLIWLRDWRKPYQRTFWFREPIELPKGSRIRVASGSAAAALISTAKPAQ